MSMNLTSTVLIICDLWSDFPYLPPKGNSEWECKRTCSMALGPLIQIKYMTINQRGEKGGLLKRFTVAVLRNPTYNS